MQTRDARQTEPEPEPERQRSTPTQDERIFQAENGEPNNPLIKRLVGIEY